MADAIPTASAEVLAAQAKAGQAGVDAYRQAQATLTQQRTGAVQQAMQEAAMRGAPAGAMESQAGIITAPYDQRLASLAQGQAAYQADMAARDQRYAAYEGAVNSARSLIPGQVELVVAPIRAQGEATIRNTERQGEMAVSEIEANRRLTEAKMAAAFQAAMLQAAKAKGGGGGGGGGGSNKLSKSGLEAMLSQGVSAQMGESIGDIDALIRQRESQATGARKTAFDTAMQQSQSQQARAQTTAADLRQQVTTQANRNRLQMLNTEGAGTLGAGRPSVNTPFGNITMSTPPTKPIRPNVRGMSADAADATLMNYQRSLKQYEADLAAWQSAQKANTMATGNQRMAELVAKQRSNAAIAGGVKPYESAYITEQAATAPYRSLFGSLSNNDLKWITQADPYLATLIANSPEALTSQNVGRLLAGQPDQYGRTDPYSQQAVQLAQEMVLRQLVEAGYEIDPDDYYSAVTPAMEPGESFAQFRQRTGGGMTDQEIAEAQEKNLRAGVEDARSDVRWEQDQAEWFATHNPDGSRIVKPEEETAPSASATRATDNDTAAGYIVNDLGLPDVPGSAFGSPVQVYNAVNNDRFLAAVDSLKTRNAYTERGGFDQSAFNSAMSALKEANPDMANLTSYQKNLLRHWFVIYDD